MWWRFESAVYEILVVDYLPTPHPIAACGHEDYLPTPSCSYLLELRLPLILVGFTSNPGSWHGWGAGARAAVAAPNQGRAAQRGPRRDVAGRRRLDRRVENHFSSFQGGIQYNVL